MVVAFQTLRSVASPFLDYCEVLLPFVHPARMLLPNVYHLGFTVGQTLQRLINHHTQPEIPSPSEISNFIVRLPYMYKDWWWNLVSNDPIHVAVETTLLASVVYMVIISRNKDYRSSERREWLSSHEQEELLEEWKEGRANLAPAKVTVSKPLVVNAYNGRTMDIMIEVDDQLDCVGDNKKVKHIPQQTVVNMATHDFLGMSCNEEVKIASRLALDKYGCGSCGPRGFYGTIDVHLQLEQAIADFTETHGAIMYSDGASAVTSTIAAFAKRGDLLVVDDGVYEPIVTGVTLSRANVEWFVHNDMSDLRRVLEKVKKMDQILGRKPCDQRRFIVVEGLYKNSGTIVPFDEVCALKHEFNYRLILDESFSFGSLGPSGKGVLELFQKRYMFDAEIVTISLENSLGSIGGITVGNEEVVDHQRLSGAGYCFSASSPPFTASAAISSLEQLGTKPHIHGALQRNIKAFFTKLHKIDVQIVPKILVCTSDERSPIVFFELDPVDAAQTTYEANVARIDSIVRDCLRNGVAMISSQRRFHRKKIPSPAIRLILTAAHTEDDLDRVLNVLTNAVLAGYSS